MDGLGLGCVARPLWADMLVLYISKALSTSSVLIGQLAMVRTISFIRCGGGYASALISSSALSACLMSRLLYFVLVCRTVVTWVSVSSVVTGRLPGGSLVVASIT